MRLLLIRHGQTTSNVGHHLDTAEPGAGLTELGWRQAQAVPQALEAERIGAIYVSTLLRTHQTAEPLATSLGRDPIVRGGIREISAGEWEMRNDDESITRYVETVFGWAEDPGRRVSGGESGWEVLDRFDAVVNEAAQLDVPSVVFVSHGAVIRVWSGTRADNIDMGYAAHHWLPNTGMVVVEGHPDRGWEVTSWSEHALGGPALNDPEHTGPAGEPEEALEGR